MNQKISQGFIWAVIIYVILTWIYNFYFAALIVHEVPAKRLVKSVVETDSSSGFVLFETIEAKDFTAGHIPLPGDTLLSIDNQTLNDSLYSLYFNIKENNPPADTVGIRIGTDSGRWDLLLVYKDIKTASYGLPLFLLGLLPLPFFAVAIWAMIKQGKNTGVKVLALLIVSFSVVFSISLEGMAYGIKNSITGSDIPSQTAYLFHVYNLPNLLLSTLSSGFWLHLALLFPAPSGFVRKKSWLVYLICYVVIIPFAISWLMDPASAQSSANWTMESTNSVIYTILSVFSILQLLAGFIIFIARAKRTQSPLEKRQVKVLLQSVGSGIIIMSIVSTLILLASKQEEMNVLLIGILFFIFLGSLMLVPLGFAYAFSRYRLLEVQGRLKRGLQFFLTTGGLLLAVFFIFFVTTSLSLKHFGIERRPAVVFVSLLVSMAYIPLHNFLQKKIEKSIFRTKWKMQEMLTNFLAVTSSFSSRKLLWEAFGERLKENIGVKSMRVLFFDKEADRFQNVDFSADALPADGILHDELKKHARPILIDEIRANNEIVLKSNENRWLDDNEVIAMIPIQLHGQMTGILALGFEYGYDEIKAEELDLLVSMTNRVALESENISLLEENIEKQRLEEQLAMARSVQERILPTVLPHTPGLDVATECKFCLEVAGDMYDVLSLPRNRTLVTIGDVSGKGAGAAMVMANLQASLRALADTDLNLSEIIKRVNKQVYRTTSAEQFVTYFAAIFDSEDKVLTYVNSGHNPPLLYYSNGKIEELGAGGLILGILPDSDYEERKVRFESGDILVTYTDGITEAEDESGEMYGENRLEELIKNNSDLNSNELLQEILKSVATFENNKPALDDTTLVIVKAR